MPIVMPLSNGLMTGKIFTTGVICFLAGLTLGFVGNMS